jgi:type II secretory pathway pseudopilin PulG
MQHTQAAALIVVIFIVVGILGILSAIALPHASQMAYQAKAETRNIEFLRIQNAIVEMLRESPSGILEPVGPTVDLGRVCTADAEPLILVDYLSVSEDDGLAIGYKYSFTADGLVIQYSN